MIRSRHTLLCALLVSGLLIAPLAARAQQAGKVPRVGVLWGGPAAFAKPYVEAGRRALGELGYVEGRDFVGEYRFGERKPGAVNVLAGELIRVPVDVIIAAGDPAIHAARRATTTIPIVMVAAGDPVRSGLVASLARPGGNVTGMTFLSRDLVAKRLEILKEAVPAASRVAVLWNPDNPGGHLDLEAAQEAARALKLEPPQSFEVRSVADVERAFGAMLDKQVQAITLLTDPVSASAGRLVSDLATKHRLPMMCELREFTDSGCLLSYGPSLLSMAQRTAFYVDKILKGAKPGDLPVEQPTNFQMVINMKTAKALGLTLPQSLLRRADQLVE